MSNLKKNLKTKRYPTYLKVFIDLSLISLLFYSFQWLELDELFVFDFTKVIFISTFWLVIAYVAGIYRSLTRYFNFSELYWISLFIAFITVSLFLVTSDFRFERLLIIGGTLFFALVPYRLFIKYFFGPEKEESNAPNTMIFGADMTGMYLKKSLSDSPHYNFIGFIDDDPKFKKRKIFGN